MKNILRENEDETMEMDEVDKEGSSSPKKTKDKVNKKKRGMEENPEESSKRKKPKTKLPLLPELVAKGLEEILNRPVSTSTGPGKNLEGLGSMCNPIIVHKEDPFEDPRAQIEDVLTSTVEPETEPITESGEVDIQPILSQVK